jgi:hypothetical protein
MAIDGRTDLGRRVRDLAESFALQFGGWSALNDMQAAAVRRAAELGALAEKSRRDALLGGACNDPLALARLEGVAARALRALGLDKRREPTGPTLHEYFAARAAETGQDAGEASADSGVAT